MAVVSSTQKCKAKLVNVVGERRAESGKSEHGDVIRFVVGVPDEWWSAESTGGSAVCGFFFPLRLLRVIAAR